MYPDIAHQARTLGERASPLQRPGEKLLTSNLLFCKSDGRTCRPPGHRSGPTRLLLQPNLISALIRPCPPADCPPRPCA